MRYRIFMFAAFLSAMAAYAGPTAAQPYRAREGVQSGQVRSLDEILNGIRRQRPGNLADVQGPNPSQAGGPRYRLKWVTPDGRVLWLDTDARTGRVLGVEGDDRGGPPVPAPRGFPGRPPGAAGPPPPQAFGRVPQRYPLQQGYPPPQGPPPEGYPPEGYPPPPRSGPPQGFGPPGAYGPRGFVPRSGSPGLARIPPGQARRFGPGR
jgi:hypothetical protein